MSAALAVALIGVPAGQAAVHAQPKDGATNTDATCAIQNPRNGEWDFYLPGDSITLVDGLGYTYKLTCAPDGHWVVEPSAATTGQPGTRPVTANPGKLAPVNGASLP